MKDVDTTISVPRKVRDDLRELQIDVEHRDRMRLTFAQLIEKMIRAYRQTMTSGKQASW